MVIGEHITRLRHEHGLTLEQLAKEAGISERYLRKIESGHMPHIKTIARLAECLDVKLEKLMEDE